MEKSVLIIGATSDVARATAHLFAKKGYELVLMARNEDKVAAISNDITIRYGVSCTPVVMDILSFEGHKPLIDSMENLPFLTICFVGYLGDQEIAEKGIDMTRAIIDANYTGPVSLLNAIASRYEKQTSGYIIGISSVAGDRGRMSNYTYGSAKAGFTAYLSGLRNRLFHKGVHVVTIKPGFMDTQMTAGMDLPKLLTIKPAEAAQSIYRIAQSKKNTVYLSWKWRYIMLIIKNIPETIFKRLKL